MNIADRVKEIVAEELGVETDGVLNENTFEELGADSLDQVELIMCLEEEYEIEISDMDAERITTVQEAIDYITSHCEPDH